MALNRTINENYHHFDEPLMLEQLLRLFFDFTVEFKYKHAVQNAFVALVELAEPSTLEQVFAVVGRVAEGIEAQALRGGEEGMEEHGSPEGELAKVHMIFYVYRCVLDAGSHAERLFDEVQSTLPSLLPLVPAAPHPDHVATLFRMADFLAAFVEKANESSSAHMSECADWFCENEQLLSWILRVYAIRGAKGQCWLSLDPEPRPEQLNDLKTRTTERTPRPTQCTAHCSPSCRASNWRGGRSWSATCTRAGC